MSPANQNAVTKNANGKPRRKRDPVATRAAILDAAKQVLAQDGPDALSVSRVAHLAGVNRGTAYQHFQTREDLIHATLQMVADQLCKAVYEDPESGEIAPTKTSAKHVVESIIEFAVENPELGRIWLFDVLSSKNPSEDKFFKLYRDTVEEVVNKGFTQKNIDVETHSVIMLSAYFIWPAWVKAHARSKQERQKMTDRMTREILRLSMYGFLIPEQHPDVAEMLNQKPDD